jgi:site-specific recombinase XerD
MSQTVKRHEAPPPARLTAVPDADDWALVAGEWTRHLRARNLSVLTVTAYLGSYRRLAGWAVPQGITMPEDVTSAHLEEFFAHLLSRTTRHGTTAKPAAVAKDYRHLRVFFLWLADKDKLVSPMAKMTAPRVPEQPVDVFTDDELRALVKACAGRDFAARRDTAIMRLLLDTGMRRAELAGLQVGDVNLDLQLVNVLGKGSRRRDVPYGARTAEALDGYLRVRRRHLDRTEDALWLAVTPHRGALGYEGVRQMLERRAQLAGVEGVFMHRFRHTAAHAYLSAGGSEGDAMKLFGWRSRMMVDRYGASAATSRAIAAARRLSVGDRI